MRDTIKKHSQFIMHDEDPAARSAFFIVRARATMFPDGARYGLVATKRTFRHAVDRNRAKRLLREWVRHNEAYLRPDLDYVFFARTAIVGASRDAGQEAMRKALGHIAKITPRQKKRKNAEKK